MSEELLIRHCAPTLAGLKTGNLFNAAFESERALRETACQLNRRFRRKGLQVVPLRYRNGRALLYVYRPEKLLVIFPAVSALAAWICTLF